MIRIAALGLALAACGGSSAAGPGPGDGAVDAATDAAASPWSMGPTLPGRRLEPGVTALGQQLVVLGGFDTSLTEGLTITTEVDLLDTAADPLAWAVEPIPAPRAWTHIQLAGSGTTLYLLGGLDGQEYIAKGDAFSLNLSDPTATAWTTLAPLPAGLERGSAAVIVAGPRIYLLGGAGTSDALATNLYYDTVMDAWCPGAACTTDQVLPDLPAPRSHPSGMRMSDGTLVLVGGLATLDSTQPAADVWWLPVDQQNAAGHWVTKTPMPTARGGCATGTIGGRLVCAGGEAGPSALHVAQLYEPALDATPPSADAWTELPDMPAERAGAQGAAIGQRLFIPGGAAELQYIPLDTLLILDLLETADSGS